MPSLGCGLGQTLCHDQAPRRLVRRVDDHLAGQAAAPGVALDHLPDPAEAGALSALMQGGGFLITALPPWIVAVLHDLTGSFVAGWLLHLACAVIVALLYWRVNPRSYERAMKPSPDGINHDPADMLVLERKRTPGID